MTPFVLPLLAPSGGFSWHSAALWDLIDFVVLAVLLVKLAGPAIGKVFSGKSQAIAQSVAESERVLAEAQRALDEQRRATQGEAVTLAEIASNARTVAASLTAEYDKDTASEVFRAREAIKAAIERERLATVSSVRAEILAAAFAEAERQIRESLGAPQQLALFATFASKASEVRP